METQFKVGEKVRVRKGLKYGKHYNSGCFFAKEMEDYMGSVVTIKATYKNEGEDRYDVLENSWTWTNDMLEPVVMTLKELQFADVLTLRNGERYVYASGCMYGEDSDYYDDCDKLEWYYNKDLTFEDKDEKEKDIIKVERNGLVIFERTEEVKEMTLKEVCDALGYEVKIRKED